MSAEDFIATIHERTPNGEWVLVKHHPNGDWSVSTGVTRGECICPKCGIRHGLSNADGGF